MKIKKIPVARKNPKYMRDFPEGTLLVAELKLPGNSLTPFETLSSVKEKKGVVQIYVIYIWSDSQSNHVFKYRAHN